MIFHDFSTILVQFESVYTIFIFSVFRGIQTFGMAFLKNHWEWSFEIKMAAKLRVPTF